MPVSLEQDLRPEGYYNLSETYYSDLGLLNKVREAGSSKDQDRCLGQPLSRHTTESDVSKVGDVTGSTTRR